MRPSALILDGTQKSALAAVRSLGQQGVAVTTAAESPRALCSWSRYSQEFLQYPSPKTDLNGFIDWLATLAEQQDIPPVVYAFSDATHLAIARSRSRLEGKIHFTWNQTILLEQAFDKNATYELARKLSVPTIKEYPSDSVVDFPVVLKPRMSVSWSTGVGMFRTAEFAFSQQQYEEVRQKIVSDTGEEPIVQEFIIGDEYGVEALCQAGEVLQRFVHRRVRSLSPRGGASVVKETAQSQDLIQIMNQYADQLLRELQWNGPAMVEFKVDRKTGAPVLMEINGRFWGSLPLAEAAGVDFVSRYYDVAQGVTHSQSESDPRYVRTQHFLGDVLSLGRIVTARDPLRRYLYPSRAKAIIDFMFSTIFDRGDIWSWRDLWPTVGEFISISEKKRWQNK